MKFSNDFKDVEFVVNKLSENDLLHICNGTFKCSPYTKYRLCLAVDEECAGFIEVYNLPDEKYEFNEMGDEFFEFLARKANEDGIYIRLVYATASETDGEAVFELEYGGAKDEYRTMDIDDVLVFEFADFGIKVKGSEVTFGATIEGGCGHTPYFAEFGSNNASDKFISLENPLNKRVISIMEEMIYD